jgi:hypothetical protein
VSIGARMAKFRANFASMLPTAVFANVSSELFSATACMRDECKRLAGYGMPVVKLAFAR